MNKEAFKVKPASNTAASNNNPAKKDNVVNKKKDNLPVGIGPAAMEKVGVLIIFCIAIDVLYYVWEAWRSGRI